MPAVPAAPFVWPICDFTEPSAHHCRRTPSAAANTSFNAVASHRSPAAVPVPCASTSRTLAGE